jgi:WD40 repeat protein
MKFRILPFRNTLPLLLLFLSVSCGGVTPESPEFSPPPPPSMNEPSPTRTKLPPPGTHEPSPPTGTLPAFPTASRTSPPTSTATATLNPTVNYPLKSGPVINGENAGRIIRLGTVHEKLAGGEVGAQLAWSPDSSRIAVTTEGEGVRIIDPLQMKEVGEIRQETEDVFDRPGGIAYTPDGRFLAVSVPFGIYSNPREVVFYDVLTLHEAGRLPHRIGANVLTFSHNGRWMAYGTFGVAGVVNLEPFGGLFYTGEKHSNFTFVLFSEDDRFFAVSGDNFASPLLLETATWSLEYELEGEICFSPDNLHFAMAPGIWELGSFQEVMIFGEDFFIGVCSFGRQGDILINSQSGTGLDIWDTATGELLAILGDQMEYEWYSFSLSPDGRLIALADWDAGGVSFWGVQEA